LAAFTAARIVARLGVRPPSTRLAQSSTRSAPASCAARKPSMPSTQSSMRGLAMVSFRLFWSGFAPDGLEEPQPVLPAELGKVVLAVTGLAKRLDERLAAGGVVDGAVNRAAFEIRTERHAVDAHALHHVVDVAHHVVERRFRAFLAVGPEHGRGVVDAGDALP